MEPGGMLSRPLLHPNGDSPGPRKHGTPPPGAEEEAEATEAGQDQAAWLRHGGGKRQLCNLGRPPVAGQRKLLNSPERVRIVGIKRRRAVVAPPFARASKEMIVVDRALVQQDRWTEGDQTTARRSGDRVGTNIAGCSRSGTAGAVEADDDFAK